MVIVILKPFQIGRKDYILIVNHINLRMRHNLATYILIGMVLLIATHTPTNIVRIKQLVERIIVAAITHNLNPVRKDFLVLNLDQHANDKLLHFLDLEGQNTLYSKPL